MPTSIVPTKNNARGAGGPAPNDDQGVRFAVFQPQFRDDLRWWTREQPRIADRIWKMIEEILRTPFSGTGKPEQLRFRGSDVWSRRITQEHRLVYIVGHERIDFLQARFHYTDH